MRCVVSDDAPLITGYHPASLAPRAACSSVARPRSSRAHVAPRSAPAPVSHRKSPTASLAAAAATAPLLLPSPTDSPVACTRSSPPILIPLVVTALLADTFLGEICYIFSKLRDSLETHQGRFILKQICRS